MKEKFAYFGQLLLFYLKRDWKKILVWVFLLGAFGAGFIPAFEEITQGDGLIGMYYTMDNPALTAMVGTTPVDAAENYTLGAMYAHEMLLFTSLISAIVSALHVVSHTRKEEDSGITELIQSFRVGRQANSLAVMFEILIVNLLLMIISTSIMMVFDADSIYLEGAILFANSIGLAGIMGGVIALVMAQLMPTSSGATGAAIGLIGALYSGRGVTDVATPELSRFNPLGWTYLTYPFTENNWHYLFYMTLFIVVGLVLAFALEGRRDIGSGYLPERTGRSEAKATLLSVPGLFLRINSGMIISWFIAFVLMGLAYGSIFGDLQVFVNSNDIINQMFQLEDASIEASYMGIITLVMIGLATILPIAMMNKVYTEEKEQRLNQIFSTKTSRFEIYWTNVVLAILVGILSIFLSSGSLGLAGIGLMEDTTALTFGDFFAAGFNQLPLVLFFIGLAALALGFAPQLDKFLYLYLTYSFFVVYFEGLVELPDWVMNISAQSWLPQLPTEEFDPTIFAVISIISFALMLVGYVGYNRRDLIEEG